MKRVLLSIISPPWSIGSEIQCTSLIKDQNNNRNDTIGKMSISFERYVDDCIHLGILLSDFSPYGKNNKQWAVLCSLTDFSFQLESFKQLWQWLCHYNNFSKPKVFGPGTTSKARSHFSIILGLNCTSLFVPYHSKFQTIWIYFCI